MALRVHEETGEAVVLTSTQLQLWAVNGALLAASDRPATAEVEPAIPAAEALEEALEARRQTQGARHPETLTALNNLGALRKAMGDLDGAAPLYLEDLEASRETLGDRHRKISSKRTAGTVWSHSQLFLEILNKMSKKVENGYRKRV